MINSIQSKLTTSRTARSCSSHRGLRRVCYLQLPFQTSKLTITSYTGAPFFSANASALLGIIPSLPHPLQLPDLTYAKGADMSHVICELQAAQVTAPQPQTTAHNSNKPGHKNLLPKHNGPSLHASISPHPGGDAIRGRNIPKDNRLARTPTRNCHRTRAWPRQLDAGYSCKNN